MRSKKGLSPLIATVLLIAFAVALGAVVMNWGREKIAEKANTTELNIDKSLDFCKDVKLEIEKVNNIPRICFSEKKVPSVQFLATNGGSSPIIKLKITVIGSAGNPVNSEIIEILGVGETKRISYTYSAEIGNLQKVKVIPVVKGDGQDKICSLAYIESSDIKPC